MGIDPLTVGLITAGASGGLSFVQAREQNQAAERAAGQQKAANQIAADAQRDQLAREFAAFEGTLRATSAARGITGGGTESALSLSAQQAGIRQQSGIATNLNFANIQADQRAAASYQSPLLSGLTGGFSGFSAGYTLGDAFQNSSIFQPRASFTPFPQRLKL